jgi:hypothetical protein
MRLSYLEHTIGGRSHDSKPLESERLFLCGVRYDYFGARYYDARIGRWLSVDPLAQSFCDVSPFCYVHNSPTNRIDKEGKADVIVRERPAYAIAASKDLTSGFVRQLEIAGTRMIGTATSWTGLGGSLTMLVGVNLANPEVVGVGAEVSMYSAIVEDLSSIGEGYLSKDNKLMAAGGFNLALDAGSAGFERAIRKLPSTVLSDLETVVATTVTSWGFDLSRFGVSRVSAAQSQPSAGIDQTKTNAGSSSPPAEEKKSEPVQPTEKQ